MSSKMYLAAALAVSTALAPAATFAKDNPIFGKAKHQALSSAENKAVVGQGNTADYYGYYGLLYAAYAYDFGEAGYTYDSYSNERYYYYYAYRYAYSSYVNFYYAYYYAGT